MTLTVMHYGESYLVLSLLHTWAEDPQTHINIYPCCYLRPQQQGSFIFALWARLSCPKIQFQNILRLNSNQSFSPLLPPAGTTREHLGLAMALKVPIFIVISKVDLCTRTTVERTVRQLERVLKQPGCNKVPMVIGSKDDAVTAVQQFVQSPKYDVCVPL